jgi:hypothetical protein
MLKGFLYFKKPKRLGNSDLQEEFKRRRNGKPVGSYRRLSAICPLIFLKIVPFKINIIMYRNLKYMATTCSKQNSCEALVF